MPAAWIPQSIVCAGSPKFSGDGFGLGGLSFRVERFQAGRAFSPGRSVSGRAGYKLLGLSGSGFRSEFKREKSGRPENIRISFKMKIPT